MKNILLLPVGSSGDVHPFIALGQEFRKRGHKVTLMTNGFFRSTVERADINFIEIGTRDEYLEATENPDLWDPRKSFPLIMQMVTRTMSPMFTLIEKNFVPGETVVAAGSLAYGARAAQIKFKIPTAMVHLQPGVFRNMEDPPALPLGLRIPPGAPNILKRGFYSLLDFIIDRQLGRPLNIFMQSVGLPRVSKVMGEWWNSPELTLGLFPDWYMARGRDWPASVKLVGFPIFDGAGGVEQKSSGVDDFLKGAEPPLVFTGGSAMKMDQHFFSEAVKVCEKLNRRGILLAQFSDQVPRNLPASVKHFSYVPFSEIFPKAGVIVHHGGIGTVSQCLKAGRPQLVIPLAHDQFDNAYRVERLGAGKSLAARHTQAEKMISLM